MVHYHYTAQIISRSAGKSAVAAAAYRAGDDLWDERYGKRHNYSRKSGVAHSEILLPTGAAEWMGNRQELWNHVEVIEKRADAQLCREINVGFQIELSLEQNLEMLRGFLHERFVSRGLVVDVAVHYPMEADLHGVVECHNPHAHVMCINRPVKDGQFGNKLGGHPRELIEELLEERAAWEDHVNAALAKAGVEGRVDHRSLEEQGITRLPQIHLGVHAHAMEKRGIRTERGELLAAILEHNQQLEAVQAQLLTEAAEENYFPTEEGGSAGQDDSSPTEGGGSAKRDDSSSAEGGSAGQCDTSPTEEGSAKRDDSSPTEEGSAKRDDSSPTEEGDSAKQDGGMELPEAVQLDRLDLLSTPTEVSLEDEAEVRRYLARLARIKQKDSFEISGRYDVIAAAESPTLRSLADGRVLMEQGILTAQFQQQDLLFLRELVKQLKMAELQLQKQKQSQSRLGKVER